MGSVLKAESSEAKKAVQPVAFNVEDIQQRARQYLEETQRQAEAILRQAREEAERIRHQAREEALAAAAETIRQQIEQESQRRSEAQCKTAVAACQQALVELNEHTVKWLDAWRNRTVEIAAKMADRIARVALNHDRALLRGWLEEALVAVREARQLRVLVHPDDFAVAGRFLQQMAKEVPQATAVEVIPDPEISPGGCIVRSQHGLIDQQLETQMERLVEQLVQVGRSQRQGEKSSDDHEP
ncbi:MAG: hypothetical protein KatS3mg111_0523 [Pirellulaceae bacterium]|nr:MAG: hypothetical protein KatS3mg111_0523 [Pirellulaceae bacterium]